MIMLLYYLQRATVDLWINRYAAEGDLTDHRSRNHGVRRVTDEQRTQMRHHYEQHGFTPTKYFADQFNVCVETIRKNLHSMGLHHRHYAKKIALTQRHKDDRYAFAQEYLDFDWTNVIFSDEKTFQSSQTGRLHLWRYNNTRYTEDHVVPNNASGRISVNLWGWISLAGVGELADMPPKSKATDYLDILEQVMLPTVRNFYPQDEVPRFSFVQDNCPIHKAGIVKNWFQQHRDEVTVIPWPAKSPDLNPIENVWGLMCQMWQNENERTRAALTEHCHQVWESMRTSDICTALIGSMRNRLLSVMQSEGAFTSY